MTSDDNDRFRIRPRPPRSSQGPSSHRFLARVHLELARAGSPLGDGKRGRGRPGARTGRGFGASRLATTAGGPRSRRVVIKGRIVVLKNAGAAAVRAHLRYIAREGVSRGDRELPYAATTDAADLDAFQARGANDRHQFRFILSPEDGAELEDLHAYTRQLMAKVETDLGTRLDWVAVDHWDTDNPHTHVVVRGKDQGGRDLVIASEYISSGMRVRASEIATTWLGPRTDLEIQAALRRDVDQERWTVLDRELQSRSRGGRIDLEERSTEPLTASRRAMLIGRLQRLETLGLAGKDGEGQWWLRDDAEAVLRRLGERGDIIRTMQRTFGETQRELALFDPDTGHDVVVGRLASKGLVDELSDRAFVVVDGVDGRAYYAVIPTKMDVSSLPVGGIVEVRPVVGRMADRNIAAASVDGLYKTDLHVARLRAAGRGSMDAEELVGGHVRRLEALRRARVVERLGEGVWRVPDDLVDCGLQHDRRNLGGADVRLLCHVPIERQIRAVGTTWLDQQLVDGWRPPGASGFAVPVQHALVQREDFLVEQGLAWRQGSRIVFARDLLATLRDRELQEVAAKMSVELGLAHRPTVDGTPVSGLYRRSIQLVSGRFAVLEGNLDFSLVPWRPVIENRLGQSLAATIRGERVAWDFGRSRGLSL